MILNPRSIKKLEGVHPDLVRVVHTAVGIATDITPPVDFIVTCGPRTLEEQRKLLIAKATRTLQSRHLPGPDGLARAVDLAFVLDGEVRWDWPLYTRLAGVMKTAAAHEGVPIVWGGDWASFKDGPHFELDARKYP